MLIDSINESAYELVANMALISVRLMVLIIVGIGVVGLLRRSSAAVKHHVYFSIMVAAITLPCLHFWVPSLAVLPGSDRPFLAGLDQPMWGNGHRENAANEQEVQQQMAMETMQLPAPDSSRMPGSSALIEEEPDTGAQPSIAAAIVIVWASVAMGLMMIPIFGQWKLRGFRQTARELDDPIHTLFDSLSTQVVKGRSVQLCIAAQDVMPMAWGVMSPMVVIPAASRNWSADRLRMVLLHELAHVRRWDCAIQWMASLACAMYWFHPGIWIIARRLRGECEHACDDAVLGAGHSASSYAAELLDISTGCRRGVLAMCAGIGISPARRLHRRIEMILCMEVNRRSLQFSFALALLALGLSLSGLLSSIRAIHRDRTPSPILLAESIPVNDIQYGLRNLPRYISKGTKYDVPAVGFEDSDGSFYPVMVLCQAIPRGGSVGPIQLHDGILKVVRGTNTSVSKNELIGIYKIEPSGRDMQIGFSITAERKLYLSVVDLQSGNELSITKWPTKEQAIGMVERDRNGDPL